MKKVIEITRNQLVEMLMNWNFGAQPATIQYVTNPKIKKEGVVQFGTITKIGAVNCIIDYNFEDAVNRQLEREGKVADFKVGSLWNGKGEHINRRVVKHIEKDDLYLAYKHQKTLRSLFFDYALNFLPVAMVKPFFYASKPQNQGVEAGKEILPRTLKIANIRKLKMRKTTYVVV